MRSFETTARDAGTRLRALASQVALEPNDPPRIDSSQPSEERQSARRWLAVAVAGCVAALFGALWWSGETSSPAPPISTSIQTPDEQLGQLPTTMPSTTSPPRTTLPPEPTTPVTAPTVLNVAVWQSGTPPPGVDMAKAQVIPVGDGELFVWGDGNPFVGNVETGEWRRSASPPIVRRDGGAVVWTGDVLIFWGGLDASIGVTNDGAVYPSDGAVYDPASDEWRLIAVAPMESRSPAIVSWDGQKLRVWGGWRFAPPSSETADIPTPQIVPVDGAAAYDPILDLWQPLNSALPPGRLESQLTLIGTPVAAWMTELDATVPLFGTSNSLFVYSADTDEWVRDERINPFVGWSPAATMSATPLVALGVTGGEAPDKLGLSVAGWTIGGGWSVTDAPPLDAQSVCITQVVRVGDRVVARRCTSVAMLDGSTWVTLPEMPNNARLVAAGTWLLSIEELGFQAMNLTAG